MKLAIYSTAKFMDVEHGLMMLEREENNQFTDSLIGTRKWKK